MADIVKTEGLVLAITDGSGNTYPFACANNSSLSITKDLIELAPKTNINYREYIQGRQTATISGSGLIKMSQSNMHPIVFFDAFIESTDTTYVGYLDLIDPQNNYKLYKFSCIIQSLSLDASYIGIPSYNFSLQVTGGFTELSLIDKLFVLSESVPARNTEEFRLVAVGIKGKWYYNYTVTLNEFDEPIIYIGPGLNLVEIVTAYIAL